MLRNLSKFVPCTIFENICTVFNKKHLYNSGREKIFL